jgi:Tfp pilus assembly protein PilF
MDSKTKMAMAAVSLVALTLISYWQVQHHDFLVWDDYQYVVENPHVRSGLNMDNLKWAFSRNEVSYRHPLAWLSHMLDCEIYGLTPRGHHLNGILFHLINTLLLFIALQRMTGALWKSALVAGLFSIHPLRIESVAWVSERKDVLGALFWILTMLSYHWYATKVRIRRFLPVLLCFAMGLMTKPVLVTLPFVLLMLDYWPLGRIRWGQSLSSVPLGKYSIGFLILEKIPLFLLVAASSIVTFLDAERIGSISSMDGLPLRFRLGHALVSYVKYILKIVWPVDLAFFYPFPDVPWPLWQVIGCAFILGLLSILGLFQSRQRPYLIIGWFWYIGTLLPMIGIVQVGAQAMADRFTYLPHLGLSIAAVWGLGDCASLLRLPKALVPVITCFIFAFFAILTYQQLRYWKDGITLFSRALEVTSRNYTAHYQLGNEWMRQGKMESAIHHLSEAVSIRPGHFPAHLNLSKALAAQGRFDEAVKHYTAALKIRPGHTGILSSMGDAYLSQGNFEEAIAYYSDALGIDPSLWMIHNNIGLAFLAKGMAGEATRHFEEALRLNPGDRKARHNLDIVRKKMNSGISHNE